MNAISATKTPQQNRFEGFLLTALFQGVPVYAMAVLLLKVTGAHQIVGDRGGAAIFVVLASLFHGVLTPWLGRKFPKLFKHGYEPLFFNATLSFSGKIGRWREQPTTSLQLVTWMILMSLLAVAVASI